MKTFVLTSIIVALLCVGCMDDRTEELAALQERVGELEASLEPPPSSIDALYPPNSREPVLLMKMYAVSTALTGAAVDFFEGDSANTVIQFERFKAEYADLSGLVPEWQEHYPTAPVDALERAFQSGNPAEVSDALTTMGAVCNDCHIENMAKTHQAYHWGDFASLTVQDPITGEDAAFPEFMHLVEQPFVGIGLSIEEGQLENARRYFESFNSRFQELGLVCDGCHETDREYFVDDEVQQTIDDIGQRLSTTPPDLGRVRSLLREVGLESCRKCHLVHVPAALARLRWEGRKAQSPE